MLSERQPAHDVLELRESWARRDRSTPPPEGEAWVCPCASGRARRAGREDRAGRDSRAPISAGRRIWFCVYALSAAGCRHPRTRRGRSPGSGYVSAAALDRAAHGAGVAAPVAAVGRRERAVADEVRRVSLPATSSRHAQRVESGFESIVAVAGLHQPRHRGRRAALAARANTRVHDGSPSNGALHLLGRRSD